MSTTLDGTTLADPSAGEDGFSREAVDVGGRHQTADGKIHQYYVRSRYKFGLRWVGRTETEKNTARAEYLDACAGVVVFSPPDTASTFNVVAILGSWKDTYIVDGTGTRRYNFSMELEEQD